MNFAFGYLIYRFFFNVYNFLRHFYVFGTRYILYSWISTLEKLDRTFAVKINLRHFFAPLYKDYSIIGRILGIIFRTIRIIIGTIIYFFVSILFLGIVLFWIFILPLILVLVFTNYKFIY
jgi:hypothetical protein